MVETDLTNLIGIEPLKFNFVYLPNKDSSPTRLALNDKTDTLNVIVLCMNKIHHFQKSPKAIHKYITRGCSKSKRERLLHNHSVSIVRVGDVYDEEAFEASYKAAITSGSGSLWYAPSTSKFYPDSFTIG